MKFAFLFPGQGSQYVGMGKDIYENFAVAKTVFDRADEILNVSLRDICFNGPSDVLRRPSNTQPAILVHSVAVLEVFKEKNIHISVLSAAGHSLGEYAALFAAGSLSFEDALLLVRKRGELMEECKNGTMAAVIGVSKEVILDVCKKTGAEIANINSDSQIVISGSVDSVNSACELIKNTGKRAILLNVGGAFHSSLMIPAKEKFSPIIENIEFKNANFPIVDNVIADYVVNADDIKKNLKEQIVKPVLWVDSIKKMLKDEINIFIEVGPGKVLTGIMKRIDKSVKTFNVDNVESFNNIQKAVTNV